MQQTPCTCQGNITSPYCCRSPLPLPSCKSRANSGTKSILGHRWSERGAEVGQRMQVVWEKTRLESSADHGPTSKVETWKERLQNTVLIALGPLQPGLHKHYLLKKISVPFYLLSKQSGTDFLNASSRMVATRGPEEDRTKSQVIMRQTL